MPKDKHYSMFSLRFHRHQTQDINHTIHIFQVSVAVSTITQLMVFNAVKRRKENSDSSSVSRHNPDREAVLPLYLGLLIHNKTRKRELIDTLYANGLSVSYARVLQFSTDEANHVIDRFDQEGLVCPRNLDNLDHNTSSTASNDAFHGTAISITQHLTNENCGVQIPQLQESDTQGSKTIKPLPVSYSIVPPISLPGNIIPPTCEGLVIPPSSHIDDDDSKMHWLVKVNEAITNVTGDDQAIKDISWSAYFASIQEFVPKPPAIVALLPLFRDSAHTITMVKHGMDIIKIQKITTHVNPGQTPILTVDQPLFAIAKKI